MLEWITDPNIWASLLTLTFLEIVLGIDNIIFLSIITERVAENRRVFAQRLGLGLALVGRLALLASLVWLTKLTAPLFEIFDYEMSWRDIILLGGGLFLLANLSFGASIVIYNSFLNEIASEDRRDEVSSKGFALGYVGGGLLLAL
ncbi:MAG TPA: TerC family protein, partial [Kiloniellaceae bacterium]|nr:TerC family protein [Kiloniellaceae bacterium]